LCAKFRTDTLALVKPQEMRDRCEYLVKRLTAFSAFGTALSSRSGAKLRLRTANRTLAPAGAPTRHFHRSTEGFYAPSSLPKLGFPEHALPTAPL
jgi:hypothetical protein